MNTSNNSQNWLQRTSTMFVVMGLLLFTGLFLLTMIISNQSIQESQDIREQASVQSGKVNITANFPQEITVGQETAIKLMVNTSGVQVEGLQLVFDVVTDVADTMAISSSTDKLFSANTEVNRVGHGFNVEYIATSLAPNRPFSSTVPEEFATIHITPQKSGEIVINFDTERSISPVYKSDPLKDELTHVTPISITVHKSQVAATSSTSEKDNFYANTSNLEDRFKFYTTDGDEIDEDDLKDGELYVVKHTAQINNRIYDERSSDPTPIYTYLEAADSGLAKSNQSYSSFLRNNGSTQIELESKFVAEYGDNEFKVILDAENNVDESDENDNEYTYKIFVEDGYNSTKSETCNESCSSNSDCSINERCYDTGDDGRLCRLAVNVNSSICSTPADQGLDRQCNEYCADTNECDAGLTCWYNQCRNPYNIDSTACTQPSSSQLTTIREGCNKTCTANADCANNLACYNGSCRLATNVSSTSCTAATAKKAASKISTNNVGIGTSSTETKSALKYDSTATTSGAVATPAPTPIPTRVPTSENISDDVANETMLDALIGSILGAFSSVSASVTNMLGLNANEADNISSTEITQNSEGGLMSYLPIAIIGLGVIVIIVVVLKIIGSLLSRGRDDDDDGQGGLGGGGSVNRPPAQWHPAQQPPHLPGHGMTSPQNATINNRGSISGGINNPQEIELPESSHANSTASPTENPKSGDQAWPDTDVQ